MDEEAIWFLIVSFIVFVFIFSCLCGMIRLIKAKPPEGSVPFPHEETNYYISQLQGNTWVMSFF